VALSGDGRRAVSASYDQTLKVWDVETGEVALPSECVSLSGRVLRRYSSS
jgi:WD40 repeat protein